MRMSSISALGGMVKNCFGWLVRGCGPARGLTRQLEWQEFQKDGAIWVICAREHEVATAGRVGGGGMALALPVIGDSVTRSRPRTPTDGLSEWLGGARKALQFGRRLQAGFVPWADRIRQSPGDPGIHDGRVVASRPWVINVTGLQATDVQISAWTSDKCRASEDPANEPTSNRSARVDQRSNQNCHPRHHERHSAPRDRRDVAGRTVSTH